MAALEDAAADAEPEAEPLADDPLAAEPLADVAVEAAEDRATDAGVVPLGITWNG